MGRSLQQSRHADWGIRGFLPFLQGISDYYSNNMESLIFYAHYALFIRYYGDLFRCYGGHFSCLQLRGSQPCVLLAEQGRGRNLIVYKPNIGRQAHPENLENLLQRYRKVRNEQEAHHRSFPHLVIDFLKSILTFLMRVAVGQMVKTDSPSS